MKREELEKLGLTKEQIDVVMATNGADIEAAKKDIKAKEDQIETLTTENKGLKDQAAALDKDIKELKKSSGDNADLSKRLSDLNTKYETDTKELNAKLEQQRYDSAVERAFSAPDIKFVSRLTRQAAINEFKSKGYKLGEDGTFAEFKGYVDGLKKEEPASFLSEKTEEPDDKNGAGEKTPTFTKQNTGGEGGAKPAFFSHGGLNYVRQPPDAK